MRFGNLPPRVILAMGWVVTVVYAFPGLMTMDSIQQLTEARAGFYTDGHPPAMAWIWHFIDKIVAGPLVMLLLQTGTFLAGLYLLLKRALPPRKAALAASLLLVFPPILAPMAVIWKDCLMAGMFLLGTAALFDERRWVRGLGLGAFVIATAVRYNAPAATLPLVVILFTWSVQQGIKRYAIAVAAWFGVTAAALGIGFALTDQPMYVWHSSLALMDTAGALARTDGTISDEKLRELFAGTGILVDKDIHAAVRKRYSPLDFESLIAGDGHLWDMPILGTEPAPPDKRAAISRMFWDAVTTYPGGYLEHRAATMKSVLAFDGPVYTPVIRHKALLIGLIGELGVSTYSNKLQNYLQQKALWVARGTPLFRPWIYLVISLVMLGFARRQRDVLAILLSGLGLEASLFLLAPTPDYRYSHWMVVCTCLAVVMLVARRSVSGHNRPRGPAE